VRMNESLDQLLKRFKKACEKEGLTRDIKRTAFYEKPSEKRRRQERQLIRKMQKEANLGRSRADSAKPRRRSPQDPAGLDDSFFVAFFLGWAMHERRHPD